MTPNPHLSEKEVFEKIKLLISKDEIDDALKVLMEHLSQSESAYFDDVILIAGNFKDLDRRIRNNLIELGSIYTEKAKINDSIIQLLNRLAKDDGKSVVQETSDFGMSLGIASSESQTQKVASPKHLSVILKIIGLATSIVLIGYLAFPFFITPSDGGSLPPDSEIHSVIEEKQPVGVTGEWEVEVTYTNCGRKKEWSNQLALFYHMTLVQDGNSITGTGGKYKEIYRSKIKEYSHDLPIEVFGQYSEEDKSIKIFVQKTGVNGKGTEGTIDLHPSRGGGYGGKISEAPFDCSGYVKCKKVK